MKDVSCGWCNISGKQSCIEKTLSDQGECKGNFIHLWGNLNTCSHDKNKNKEAEFDGKEENEDADKKEIKIIDPLTKKRLLSELKYYLKDVEEKKKNLENLITLIESLKNEMSKVKNTTDSDIYKKYKVTEDQIEKGFFNY